MFGFSRGQVSREELHSALQHVGGEVEKLASELRTLQVEQENLHAQVRKWMRRAVAAEKRLEDGAPAALPPVNGHATRNLTSVRLRRLMRAQSDLKRAERASVVAIDGSEPHPEDSNGQDS